MSRSADTLPHDWRFAIVEKVSGREVGSYEAQWEAERDGRVLLGSCEVVPAPPQSPKEAATMLEVLAEQWLHHIGSAPDTEVVRVEIPVLFTVPMVGQGPRNDQAGPRVSAFALIHWIQRDVEIYGHGRGNNTGVVTVALSDLVALPVATSESIEPPFVGHVRRARAAGRAPGER